MIGSEGNIGAPLVAYLRSVGYEVLGFDLRPGWREDYLTGDITHPVDLIPAFDWGPDVVFLLAATVGRMVCEQAGSLAVSTNVAGVNNVLQLCKRANARCVSSPARKSTVRTAIQWTRCTRFLGPTTAMP